MVINFDSLNQNSGVNPRTTSQQVNRPSESKGIGAYALDISDKVKDNLLLRGQGSTLEGSMPDASDEFLGAQQDFMTIMSNFLSPGDYEKLRENGFDPADVDAETVVTVVDEIKAKLAEAGITIQGYNDDLSIDDLERITGSKTRSIGIAETLKENDIPVNRQNVTDVLNAMAKCDEITDLSEGAQKYLVENQRELTIDNVYRARFSAASAPRQGYGYYAEEMPGYYSKKAEEFHWDKIDSRISEVITKSGLEVTDETMRQGRWLVEQGIPLNSANLLKKNAVDALELPIPADKALNAITNALMSGKRAEEANIADTESFHEHAARLLDETASITDDAVYNVVKKSIPLTLQNLVREQNSATPVQEKREEVVGNSLFREYNHAKLQLEEIRLKMTFEANLRMLKSGYSIDTTQLSRLVEDMKEAENSNREVLYNTVDPEELEARDNLYTESLQKTAEIREMPLHVIGKVAGNSALFTLNYIHTQGSVLRSQYDRVGAAYETLMTTPNAELGDNIKKAFRNVDDILRDLGFEVNEINERAVRILGYNNMFINDENLLRVREADSTVRRVVQKMTPAATLAMIRDGINPLSMNLDELDNYLNKNQSGKDGAENYAHFLYRLDRKKGITASEREAFIGIYRLMRQVEKSDGAVIGNLVNQGAEMSFRNLLSAVRSAKHRNRDYRVDDSFGGVQGGIKNADILNQITQYYESMAKEIADHVTPELIEKELPSYQQLEKEDTTLDTFYGKMQQYLEQNTLQEQIAGDEIDREYISQNLEEARAVQYVSEDALHNLLNNHQEITVNQLIASDYLLSYRGATYRKLFDYAKENGEERKASLMNAMQKLQRNLTDEENAGLAYDNLADEAQKLLEETRDSKSTYGDVRSILNYGKQIELARKLAKNENYEVPIDINGEINSVNLQIDHQNGAAGQVRITMETEWTGKVMALFTAVTSVGEQGEPVVRMEGTIASNLASGMANLQSLDQRLREELTEYNREITGITYTQSRDLALNTSRKLTASEGNEDTEIGKVSNKALYDIARSFIIAIQTARGE